MTVEPSILDQIICIKRNERLIGNEFFISQ